MSRVKPDEEISYDGLHWRVCQARGPAKLHQCVRCPKRARDWATLHTETGLDIWADYVPLCRGCHLIYDGNSRGPHTLTAAGRAAILTGIAGRLAATGCSGCGIDRTGDQYTAGCKRCHQRRADRRRVPRGR